MSKDQARHGHVIRETYWNVDRGHSVTGGFSSSAAAHEQAKPHGFRTAGVVVRVESTRSLVYAGDTVITTETVRRITEDTE